MAFSQERKKKKNILPIDHIISSKKLATLASKPKPTNFPFCPSRVVVPQTSFSPGEDSIVFLEEGGKKKMTQEISDPITFFKWIINTLVNNIKKPLTFNDFSFQNTIIFIRII